MLTLIVLGLVTLQRCSEVIIARRNTKALLAQGAKEFGAGHYPVMVLLHASWLAGLWYFAWNRDAALWLLAIYAVLQVLRLWILATLGRRWTTRVIRSANEKLVARGPYNYLRHPNYVVVALEIPLLPLVFGLNGFAVTFGLLNLAMLAWRIHIENQALGYSS
jgi:methyltransferase